MKKSLKKVALTCAAATALMAAMSISALAADAPTIGEPAVNDTTGVATVQVSGKIDANKEATILVLKPGAQTVDEDTIAYINQVTADAEGNYTFDAKFNTKDAEGTYTVRVGGQDQPSFGEGNIDIGGGSGDVVWGDTDGDGKVEAIDATKALQASVKKITLEGNNFKAADLDGNGTISADEATKILQASVKKVTLP